MVKEKDTDSLTRRIDETNERIVLYFVSKENDKKKETFFSKPDGKTIYELQIFRYDIKQYKTNVYGRRLRR